MNEPVNEGNCTRGDGSIPLSGFFYVSGESLVAGNCPLKEALSVPHFNYSLYPSILQNALPASSVLLTGYHLLTCRTVYTSGFVSLPYGDYVCITHCGVPRPEES